LKKEASEKLSEQAGHTLNIITRDILETSTNVYYAGGVADAASITTAVSKNDIDNIVNILERNNVKRGLKFVSSSSNFNTTPIDDAYVGIVHPDVAKDIRNLDNFIPVASYGERNRMEQEIGEVGGIRFVIDTDCKIDTGAGGSTTTLRNTGGNADVYSCYILGDDAFGRVSFKNKNIKLIDKPLGSAGTGDALDQKASMGWKIRYGAVIMYMEKVLIYKVGATK
jgi:N4-gp56 family major capsid protein